METTLWAVLPVAVSVAFVHTLAGPDHYLPFVAMAKARNWSAFKTTWVTAACGLGHVASSILLALLASAAWLGAARLEWIESTRGDLAAWALIAFGLVYTVWGLKRAFRNRPHHHVHAHADGTVHAHPHDHHGSHAHAHPKQAGITPWVLFTIFLLGPCEPLIPLLMLPAVAGSFTGAVVVGGAFTLVTIGTMLAAVHLALRGLGVVRLERIDRFAHALAGGTVLMCGVAIGFLGL